MKGTNIKGFEIARRQALVLQTDHLLNKEQKAQIVQSIKEQIEKDGVVFIPYGVKAFSLDVDEIVVSAKTDLDSLSK